MTLCEQNCYGHTTDSASSAKGRKPLSPKVATFLSEHPRTSAGRKSAARPQFQGKYLVRSFHPHVLRWRDPVETVGEAEVANRSRC